MVSLPGNLFYFYIANSIPRYIRREYVQVHHFFDNSFVAHLLTSERNSYHHLTKLSSGGLELSIPHVAITQNVCLVWAEKDLGPSVLAILKNYKENSNAILGQSFVVVSERITYAEFVKILEEGACCVYLHCSFYLAPRI